MGDYTTLRDTDLIAKCLDQDAEAWEQLLRRYQRLITSITIKFGISTEDASDIFQSVVMTLFQQLPSLRKQDKLSSWIITVTVRECWKFKQRQNQTESIDDLNVETNYELVNREHRSIDESLLSLEKQHLIRQTVALLPEQCRRLIEHLFYRETPTSYLEISQQFGIPVASIGPTRARCLAKLKASLKKFGFI